MTSETTIPTTQPTRRLHVRSFVKLARPHQWLKNAFVLVGPFYGLGLLGSIQAWPSVLGAVLAFGFASSSMYVFNDMRDVEQDRRHHRKKKRPIASGAVSIPQARVFGVVLLILCALSLLVPLLDQGQASVERSVWLAACVGLYVVNVSVYTAWFKRAVILDVMCLSMGFVLRVLGGCAAVGVEPSTWLLNCTFFLAMFLAFGKRLGERQTMDEEAVASARSVQQVYTAPLLRMVVVVTAVATLITYAGYVQAQVEQYIVHFDSATEFGFNLLWLTMLPATYALLRAIVLVEAGTYDDPTVLASKDLPFQVAAGMFGVLTVGLMLLPPGG